MTSSAEIGNLRVRLGIDSAEFAAGVRAVQGQLSTLGSSLKAFATGAAAVSLFTNAIDALHQVADLGDVAESIGISAEQLQVFQRMALASGASTDMLVKGLQSIAEQSVDANSKLVKLFTANGIATAGKDVNQIILDFMDLLKYAKTPAEQLAIATDVLGTKVGRQLVEAFRTGASGANEAYGEMKQSGNYMADAAVADAQRIETAYNQMTANIAMYWQRMVVEVAKGAENMLTALDPILHPDFSKGTAFGELMNLLSGKEVNWNFGSSPGYGFKLLDPTGGSAPGKGDLPGNVNLGTSQLNKPTTNPSIQKPPSKSVVPAVPKDTIDSIYGAGTAFDALWQHMEAGIPETNSLTDAFQSMAETISDSLGNALQGLISGTMSVKDAFASMAQSISQQLSALAAQLIKSSIMKVLQLMLGGGGAGLNIGGMTFGGLFADGGRLGSGKWGIAGEAGPEIVHGPANITPMDRGGSAPQMNVTVINNSSAAVSTRKGANGNLEVMVEEMIADKLMRGGNKVDAALQRGYGLRRAGRS